jgi:YTH domain-containing family protein
VPQISVDSNTIDLPSEGQVQAGASNISGDHNAAYPHNFYASQGQPFYYQGHENSPHEWDAYPPYMSAEGLEVGPTVSRIFFSPSQIPPPKKKHFPKFAFP